MDTLGGLICVGFGVLLVAIPLVAIFRRKPEPQEDEPEWESLSGARLRSTAPGGRFTITVARAVRQPPGGRRMTTWTLDDIGALRESWDFEAKKPPFRRQLNSTQRSV